MEEIDSLYQLKKDFEAWCGFSIESKTGQEMQEEVDHRLGEYETELYQQAKIFRRRIKNLFPDEDLYN